jgi:type IX secretion system PorP/SprF family membrane protein
MKSIKIKIINMRAIRIFVMGGALLLANYVSAQQIATWNNYIFNPYMYNPARTGDSELGTVYFNFKKQWTDMPEAPLSNLLTFDMPVQKNNMGIGAQFLYDKAHLQNTISALFTYAYHIPLNKTKDHRISIGLSGGIINERIDLENAVVTDPTDPIFELGNNIRSTTFDASAGINYHFKGLNVGFSVPHIFANDLEYATVDDGLIKRSLARHYFVSASYRAAVGAKKEFFIEPVISMRRVKPVPYQFDANVILDWKKTVWGAFGYRSGSGFAKDDAAGLHGSIGAGIRETAMITYTFESPLGKLDRSALGVSHELLVGFKIGKKVRDLEKAQEELAEGLKRTNANVADIDEKVETQSGRIDKVEDLVNQNMNSINDNKAAINDLNRKIDNEIKTVNELIEKSSNLVFEKLGSVYFNVNSSKLTPEAKARLDAIKEVIKTPNDKFVLYIAGNASVEGNAAANLLLSTQRSGAVIAYLREIGIKEEMFIISNGKENPVTEQQKTEAQRTENRRVDIFIIGE